MNVEFGFELDDRVKILALDAVGVVTMLGCDRVGPMYHVVSAGTHGWFYGDQIGVLKDEPGV